MFFAIIIILLIILACFYITIRNNKNKYENQEVEDTKKNNKYRIFFCSMILSNK